VPTATFVGVHDTTQLGGPARYDGVAEWFDRELATAGVGLTERRVAQRPLTLGHLLRTFLDTGFRL
jgi:hypothetical protein